MTDTTLTVTPLEERAIRIRRSFDAPRPLVYEAFTTPALLRRWLGPATWEMTVCEIDLRVGGAWRYVMHGPDGAVMVMQGTYQELDPPARIVTTESFDDDWTGGETLNTTVFDAVDDGTEVTITVLYASTEARDGALASGMERGMAEGFDRLVGVLSDRDADRPPSEIADRYRRRADRFEATVAAAKPERWDDPSPCDEWTARGVVGHIIDMHGVMLRPLDRELSPAPSLDVDPLGAFRSARADIEALLADPAIASSECATPMGTMTLEEHVDGVVSTDLVDPRLGPRPGVGPGRHDRPRRGRADVSRCSGDAARDAHPRLLRSRHRRVRTGGPGPRGRAAAGPPARPDGPRPPLTGRFPVRSSSRQHSMGIGVPGVAQRTRSSRPAVANVRRAVCLVPLEVGPALVVDRDDGRRRTGGAQLDGVGGGHRVAQRSGDREAHAAEVEHAVPTSTRSATSRTPSYSTVSPEIHSTPWRWPSHRQREADDVADDRVAARRPVPARRGRDVDGRPAGALERRRRPTAPSPRAGRPSRAAPATVVTTSPASRRAGAGRHRRGCRRGGRG